MGYHPLYLSSTNSININYRSLYIYIHFYWLCSHLVSHKLLALSFPVLPYRSGKSAYNLFFALPLKQNNDTPEAVARLLLGNLRHS